MSICRRSASLSAGFALQGLQYVLERFDGGGHSQLSGDNSTLPGVWCPLLVSRGVALLRSGFLSSAPTGGAHQRRGPPLLCAPRSVYLSVSDRPGRTRASGTERETSEL